MRKLVYALFAAITVYLASMYRLPLLTTLFIAEMLLLILMFVMAHVFRLGTSVALAPPAAAAQKGREADCRLTVSRRGRVPGGQLRLRLHYRYLRESREHTRILCLDGQDEQLLPVCGRSCGLLELRIDRLWTCDYLQLFSPGKRVSVQITMPVFPRERMLRFARTADSREAAVPEEISLQRPGENDQEIRQIREYRPGDARRFIHWNQSARTGDLWIKEYERQEEPCAVLLLDCGASGPPQGADAWDAFYELLTAVINGLLQCTPAVQVCWYDPVGAAGRTETIYDAAQCRLLLYQLYQAEPAIQEGKPLGTAAPEQDHLRLTTDLALYHGTALLAHFTQQGLHYEIAERIITI